MVDRIEAASRRPRAGEVSGTERRSPTRIRGVGVQDEVGLRKVQRDPDHEVGRDGPPPKIWEARIVPGNQIVVPETGARHLEPML